LQYDPLFTAMKQPLIARRKTGLAKNGTLCMVRREVRPVAFPPICNRSCRAI